MTKEGSIQIINFMTPGAVVLAKWVWPYKSYSENTLFLEKYSYLLPGIGQSNYLYSYGDQ